MNDNQIVIYQSPDGQMQIDVHLSEETVWLDQRQMADLFGRDYKTISKHINNVFREGELDPNSVVAKFATTAADGKTYQVEHYNLDVIISVGYRVKSKRGTQFRIWATQVLKDHLVQGYTLNEKRLRESEDRFQQLQKAVALAAKVSQIQSLSHDESEGILKVLDLYAYALDILDQYDHQRLAISGTVEKTAYRLTFQESVQLIDQWRMEQGTGTLFGNQKDDSFKSSLETIYQSFGGNDLYPSIEEKAANLLYFIVKNHSFTDGNKRIAAGLFVYFLDKNEILLRPDGQKRIADNALVAITLMIAESRPDEKDIMVKLVVNLINQKN